MSRRAASLARASFQTTYAGLSPAGVVRSSASSSPREANNPAGSFFSQTISRMQCRKTVILPNGRSSNRSLATVEPVSSPRKRKLENSEQRPATESRSRRTEIPEVVGQRLVPAGLTCGNVDAFRSASKLVDQAWKLRFLPTGHQLSPRIRMQPQLSAMRCNSRSIADGSLPLVQGCWPRRGGGPSLLVIATPSRKCFCREAPG